MSPCRQARNRRSDYSLSRHSPYTSKSNPGRLRASSTRPVLICMCMAHCFAQKKHLRDAGAFVMYVTRFELATFWSVARRSIQLSYTYTTQVFYKIGRVLSISILRNFGKAGGTRRKNDHNNRHDSTAKWIKRKFRRRIPIIVFFDK